jgi:hypothetical protein
VYFISAQILCEKTKEDNYPLISLGNNPGPLDYRGRLGIFAQMGPDFSSS